MTTSRPPGRTSSLDASISAADCPARRDTSGGDSRHLSSGCLRSVPVPVHGASTTTRSQRPLHGGRRASAATRNAPALQPAQVVAHHREALRRGVGQHALDARLDRLEREGLAAGRGGDVEDALARSRQRQQRGRLRRLVLHVEVAAAIGLGLRAAIRCAP